MTTVAGEPARQVDAHALGLVRPRGQRPDIDLASVKRKRPESSQSGSTAGGSVGGSPPGLGHVAQGQIGAHEGRREAQKERRLLAVSRERRYIQRLCERGAVTRAQEDALCYREGHPGSWPGEPWGAALAASKAWREVLLEDDDDDDLVIV